MGMHDDILFISLFNANFKLQVEDGFQDFLNPPHLCKKLVFVESLPLENNKSQTTRKQKQNGFIRLASCMMYLYMQKNEECIKTCLSYNADVDNHDRIHMV